MEIHEHHIPVHLPLANTYCTHFSSISDLYDYNPNDPGSFIERYHQLQTDRFSCPREDLIEALLQYNRKVGNENGLGLIERLKDPRSVVVIGGQQPGILSGPLYTIYKAMTIIRLARSEEKRLQVPVIPVLWIAGEDHDWDEVNHVYTITSEHELKKLIYSSEQNHKGSVSHYPLEHAKMKEYVDKVLDAGFITEYTNSLRDVLYALVDASNSFGEFFAKIIVKLCGEEAIVLFDSAEPVFRKLEGAMFARILDESERIAAYLSETTEEIRHKGYQPQVESYPDHAHLFLYEGKERIPLIRAEGKFQVKNTSRTFTKEEMIKLAQDHPERFSCNVVTRPLMQEYLFPVLAFVGGPGEISYWGQYRKIFRLFSYKMPVIIPRISISIMESHSQKLKERFQLSFVDMVENLEDKKREWLSTQDHINISATFATVKEKISDIYQPLLGTISVIEKGLQTLGENNLKRILDQIEYLHLKTQQSFETRHQVVLRQFDRAGISLMPDGKPQERVLNPFYFINKYGWVWWYQFISMPLEINGLHKEVIL